jgi:hypothetical protein
MAYAFYRLFLFGKGLMGDKMAHKTRATQNQNMH